MHKIQYNLKQELEKEKLPPRSSVYKRLRRLKSANLVREKVKRIPPDELPKYRGWRVKRNKETKQPEIGENGNIEIQYGFELTKRGEAVTKFLDEHLEPSKPKEKSDEETGDK